MKAKKKGFYFKLNFITLTLTKPQQHPDTYIVHHMLIPFLKYLRRSHNVINYIWKAEIQPERLLKRGERCIHFHITTNKFIHWKKVRNKWNELQLAHGYREENTDPNSTDIHSVINEKQAVHYMSKYITKEPEKDDYPDTSEDEFQKLFVTCKVWAMNHELSNMRATLLEEDTTNISDDISCFLDSAQAQPRDSEHGELYLHKLNLETKYGDTITKLLADNYVRFMKGDDGTKKYNID